LMSWAEEISVRPQNSNPCLGVKKYPEVKRERFLTLDEVARLARSIQLCEDAGAISVYAAAAIRLLIFTGARLGEILTLQWDHVDLDRDTLWLPDSKTGKKTIALSPQSAAILRSIPRISNNPYVIVGRNGDGHMVNLGKPWGIVKDGAKLAGLRLHDLRHTFASIAAAEGASLPVIGKLLGHTQAATTARYAHLTEDQTRQLNNQVGQAIEDVTKK